MADQVHANTKLRGIENPDGSREPPTLACGTLRVAADGTGTLVTGDPSLVTCPKCKGK